MGTPQIKEHITLPQPSTGSGVNESERRVVSTNRLLARASTSSTSKAIIKRNVKAAICVAAVKLFIPSQTLKMPSVSVSIAKYSTVPKSETVSIKTSANPATIAGRANGNATPQN